MNADDFGLHEDINTGIIKSHHHGCVTSTTIMAGGQAFHHAVSLAEKHPKLSVGVHLTLVGAKPVSRGRNLSLLTSDGKLLPQYTDFVKKYMLGAIDKKDISHELYCQMQKVAGSGIKISHIDSHQHLHALPGMAKIIGNIAHEFGVEKIRLPAEPIWFFKGPKLNMSRICARSILTGCALTVSRQYKRLGMYCPDHFFGMLAGGFMRQTDLELIIENLPDGVSEIMVHPGTHNDILNKMFPWDYHWEEELQALTSEVVLSNIVKKGIRLISYRELRR